MREILFRGKRVDNGEWVEGFYHCVTDNYTPLNRCYITVFKKLDNGEIVLTGQFEVVSETVGQYTGLADKNGTKIFEGDIIRELDGGMDGIPREVRWDKTYMMFKCPLVRNHWAYGYNDRHLWLMQGKNIEVIGNIHDNPELLESEVDTE